MSNRLNSQDLIDEFLEAIRLRQLERCQKILESLRHRFDQEPGLELWHQYLTGYFVFEAYYDWAEADRIFAELLQIDVEPELRRRVLYALGRSLDAQGRWEEAIATFEQSLLMATQLAQIMEQARAWKHMAISLNNGFTRGDFGLHVLPQALAYCQSALEVIQSIAERSADIAYLEGSIWNTLGLIQVSRGQWDEAISCYQHDLAICQAMDDRHGMGLTYGNLAEVYQKQGRDHWPDALAAYQEALALIREFDNRYDEIEALTNIAFLYQEMGQYDLALGYYRQAIESIEALRANISSEAARTGFFATIENTFAHTALLCLAAGQPEQAFDIVEQARSRAFLDILAGQSSELLNTVESKTITLAQVQAALPANALLLEYFTTGLVETGEGQTTEHEAARHRFPPGQTLVFAVTGHSLEVHNIHLSPNHLRPAQLDSVVEQHFLKPKIRRTLYDKLVAPVEHLFQAKRRLYLIPHGPLHYIPFQALLAPDGDTLLRQEGPQLIYAPSATLLFRDTPHRNEWVPKSCLAVGYNSQAESQLHFAEDEARRIAGLTGGEALIGPALSKTDFYNEARNYRLIHLACHGEFDPETPLNSFLHLAAGAKLTALDVINHLRLHCDLVTLSACESGLSRIRRGDELIGFMRAFLFAGTPALISSLWQVDDYSTCLLMEKFYQKVQSGLELAEALKQAQLYLRNLTFQEAVAVLAPIMADDELTSAAPSNGDAINQSDPATPKAVLKRAGAYLRGITRRNRKSGGVMQFGAGEEEKVFADPYYWAAFVLIDTQGSNGV